MTGVSLSIVITPEADRDLEETALFIETDSPSAAKRFLDAATAGFSSLSDAPRIGVCVETGNPAMPGLRRWRVPGFENHLIFYQVTEETITVIRVLHGARDIEAILSEE